MESLQKYIYEYRKQMKKGAIQKAYKGLMKYMMDLRTDLSKRFPGFALGSIYPGYMDMTYFPVFPKSLKSRKLKIAIVLIHDTLRFEVWLVGSNRQVQEKYWRVFKEGGWNKYRIPDNIKGADYITECTLVDNSDFGDFKALTKQIEKGTLKFINDIEDFISKH
jgi:hypothetical protein